MRNSINVHDWLWLCSRETLLHSNGFLWRANQPLYCAQDVSFWGWISGSRAGTRWPMWAFGTLNAAEQASKWPVVYPGTHMTLLFGDLMYKLWYVCEFSKLIWCFRWEMNMWWASLCMFFLLRHKARKPSHQLRWRPQIMWLRWVRLSNTNTVGAVRKVAEQS